MIRWEVINNFSPTEFVDDVNLAESKLIMSLDEFREYIDSPIHPSPVKGSLVRLDPESSYSRHYAVGRLSDAVDVFCDADPAVVWHKAVSCGLWGGIGIYFDTTFQNKEHFMFHLDCRPRPIDGPIIWARYSGRYTKPMQHTTDLKQIMRLLG